MKLTAGMLRQIIKEEVAAVRATKPARRLVSEVYALPPEEDRVARVLNQAMGEPNYDVDPDFFIPTRCHYWFVDEGVHAGQIVFEQWDETNDHPDADTFGCIPDDAQLKEMGMKSYRELKAFLDGQGVPQVRNPKELQSAIGREAAGLSYEEGRKYV